MNLLFVTISLSFSSKLKLFWAIISHHLKSVWSNQSQGELIPIEIEEENETFHPEPQSLIIFRYMNIMCRLHGFCVRFTS